MVDLAAFSAYFPLTNKLFSFVIFMFLVVVFLFHLEKSLFNISCKTGLVVLNTCNFCLSVKLLTSFSNLIVNFAIWCILGHNFSISSL